MPSTRLREAGWRPTYDNPTALGLLLEQEVTELTRVIESPARPMDPAAPILKREVLSVAKTTVAELPHQRRQRIVFDVALACAVFTLIFRWLG